MKTAYRLRGMSQPQVASIVSTAQVQIAALARKWGIPSEALEVGFTENPRLRRAVARFRRDLRVIESDRFSLPSQLGKQKCCATNSHMWRSRFCTVPRFKRTARNGVRSWKWRAIGPRRVWPERHPRGSPRALPIRT